MAKGDSVLADEDWNVRRSTVNTDAPWPDAGLRHGGRGYWGSRRSCTVGLLMILIVGSTICTTLSMIPAFLRVDAWQRVKGNRGARSAGVDGQTAYYISVVRGEEEFLGRSPGRVEGLGRFVPAGPCGERVIPKAGGKFRRLGIPTVRDRVVQAALKLVLEPIFEADFKPMSYGFRPKRRAQDAIAEIHYLASRSYEWVLEGDITACFDEISHVGLMDRLRDRIGDKRVLRLVKAFLKAGMMTLVMVRSSRGIRSPALPKAGSSRLFSPMWPSRSLTITSPRPGRRWATVAQRPNAKHDGARVWPTTG